MSNYVENKNIFETLALVFIRGWDSNDYTTKARCETYIEEIRQANEKLESGALTRREKKKYIKQKQKATEALEYADLTNKMFINKAFASIAVSAVSIYKIISVLKNTNI